MTQVSMRAKPDDHEFSKQEAIHGVVSPKDFPDDWKFVSYANKLECYCFERNPDGNISLEKFLLNRQDNLNKIFYTYIYS